MSNDPEITDKEKPASLAKTIASRTTDLLVIALLIVVLLTLGRQLSIWWAVEEPGQVGNPVKGTVAQGSTQWGAEGQPVEIFFGDSKVLFQRTEISGSQNDLRSKIVQQTTEKIQQSQPREFVVSESESKLLEYLTKFEPVASVTNRELVYLIGGPIPVVWGVKKLSDSEQRRIVCWGTCLAKGKNRWTFFLSPFGSIEETNRRDQKELPAFCKPVLALQNADGSAMISFQCDHPVDLTKEKLKTHFTNLGWTNINDWSFDSSATFVKHDENEKTTLRADIQIRPVNEDRTSGMIVTTRTKDSSK